LENASRFPLFPASAATPSSPSRTPPATQLSLYDPCGSWSRSTSRARSDSMELVASPPIKSRGRASKQPDHSLYC
jgi:hypothetical protein